MKYFILISKLLNLLISLYSRLKMTVFHLSFFNITIKNYIVNISKKLPKRLILVYGS